jgi:hypothetical protein
MRSSLVTVALAASVLLVGCLGGEGQPAQPTGGANPDLPECPSGEDAVTGVFDLGANPKGVPTARGAVTRFLRGRKSDLSADAFERTDRASGGTRRAVFSYSREGSRLVRLYVERLERGWLVIAYAFCRGAL